MNGFNFSDASEIYFGSTKAKEVYYGNTKIWGAHDYSLDYLTIEFLESGKLQVVGTGDVVRTIEYSANNGTTWNSITTIVGSWVSLGDTYSVGEKVLLRGSNTNYATSATNRTTFRTTGQTKVYGNIMSLIYGDNFIDKITLTDTFTFTRMFYASVNIIDAKNLVLPATTITNQCYRGMFEGATGLMYSPQILPALTLPVQCYQGMFNGCTGLTTAPELPATTLATNVYRDMFNGCISLTEAPELPATVILNNCYNGMFYGCQNINRIKCLAITTTDNATTNWVDGVAATGTFVKSANATFWTTGVSGIPSGWTIENV